MIHDIVDVKQVDWSSINEGDTLNITRDQTNTLYISESNIVIEGNGFLFGMAAFGRNWGITGEEEFSGITVHNVRVTGAKKDGIRVAGNVSDCETSYCGDGVQMRGSGSVTRCKSHHNTRRGIIGSGGNVTVQDCDVHDNNESGIEIGRWTSDPDNEPWIIPTITNNRCYGNKLSGINVHYKVENGLIQHNWVNDNGGGDQGASGIHVGGSPTKGSARYIVIVDNYVANQKQVNADGAGILLDDSSVGCISTRNDLWHNEECGVKFHNCDYPRSLYDRVTGSIDYKISRPRNEMVLR